MSRVAAIDLGTNTVRIIVAEPEGKGYTNLFSDQVITRLGEGLHVSGKLKPEAMKRTCDGVAELLKRASFLKPFTLRISATSAARDAANTDELDRRIHQAAGVGLDVISWENEARFSLAGARLAIGDIERFILFDIGGGSTEYILSVNGAPAGSCGTNLGVVRLAETYITQSPVLDAEYDAMVEEIEKEVNRAFTQIGARRGEVMVGTAGTVTSLAAIALDMVEYSPSKINNYKLTADKIEELRKKLSVMTIEERSRIPALKGGREDLIIPGVAIIQSTLKRAGRDHLLVSDYGLREGLVLDILRAEVHG